MAVAGGDLDPVAAGHAFAGGAAAGGEAAVDAALRSSLAALEALAVEAGAAADDAADQPLGEAARGPLADLVGGGFGGWTVSPLPPASGLLRHRPHPASSCRGRGGPRRRCRRCRRRGCRGRRGGGIPRLRPGWRSRRSRSRGRRPRSARSCRPRARRRRGRTRGTGRVRSFISSPIRIRVHRSSPPINLERPANCDVGRTVAREFVSGRRLGSPPRDRDVCSGRGGLRRLAGHRAGGDRASAGSGAGRGWRRRSGWRW